MRHASAAGRDRNIAEKQHEHKSYRPQYFHDRFDSLELLEPATTTNVDADVITNLHSFTNFNTHTANRYANASGH
jgi:hypothetical protein